MRKSMLLGALATALASVSPAAGLQGKVVGVTDGQTMEILSEGKVYRVRLHGIACPARNESVGKASRRFLAGMSFMAEVGFEPVSAESDGTLVGKVLLADGRNPAVEMIMAGMAWWNSESAPQDTGLARIEKAARDSKSGVWAAPEDGNAVDWRREILARRAARGKGVAGLFTGTDRN